MKSNLVCPKSTSVRGGLNTSLVLGSYNNYRFNPELPTLIASMDFNDAFDTVSRSIESVSLRFHRLPGSSIVVRYIQNSYQNDPVRSVVELMLFLFAVHYLLAPRYSTTQKELELTKEVCYYYLPLVYHTSELETPTC